MLKYDPFRDGVSQGLLMTFMRCREEASNWLKGLEQLRSSSALQFGSMAHQILEEIYGKYEKPPSDLEVLKMIEKVRMDFVKEEGSRMSEDGLQNLEQNVAILTAVLPGYFRFYKSDFRKDYWAELEQVFRVPSPVKGVALIGRIDGAFRPNKKELWLFESKTKSRIEEDNLADSLTFDFQNSLYQYALQKKYGVQPSGVLYNIIRRPGQKLKKEESLPDFSARIEEEVRKDPSYYFIRFEVAVPRTELKRFEHELEIILTEFISWWKGEIATYRNTSACMQRFGPCRFLPLCANGEVGLYRTRQHLFPELVEK